MLVLGIETSCDETACAVVRDGRDLLSNAVSSQADLHALYGGVYPELACRRHLDLIIPMIDQALLEAEVSSEEIDLISVTQGPGLIGALLLGMHAAKALSLAWNRPFIGVNHLEAHIYSALMSCESPKFPALAVVLSGGHTLMVSMERPGSYKMIGQTVDDAIGEAFDKVAVLLGLSYPGGAQIELLAQKGDPRLYSFKAGLVKNRPWDFSFSGLKTHVLYRLKGQNHNKSAVNQLSSDQYPHIAAAFQEAALQEVTGKIIAAAEQFGAKMILLGGGVTQNRRLRQLVSRENVYWPLPGLECDNGAMVAALGYALFLDRGCRGDSFDLEPSAKLNFF